MNDISKRVDSYFAMWNQTDPARCRAAFAAASTLDSAYLDPVLESGAERPDSMVVGVQERYPEHRFRLIGDVDVYHRRTGWAWEIVAGDGQTRIVAGVDLAILAPDGRLRQVTGFFERPAGAAA